MDSGWGRFTTRDTIGVWGDPTQFGNANAYASSNAQSRIDPMGRSNVWPTRIPRDITSEEVDKRLKDPNITPKEKEDYRRIKKLLDQKKRIANKNKGMRGGRRGAASTKTLGTLASATCIAAAAKQLDTCLQHAEDEYLRFLRGIRCIKDKDEYREAEELADESYDLDVADCAAKYSAQALACLVPFAIPEK